MDVDGDPLCFPKGTFPEKWAAWDVEWWSRNRTTAFIPECVPLTVETGSAMEVES